MLGVEQVKKLLPISTSNNTIQRRISSLSTDINSQVVEEQEISMGCTYRRCMVFLALLPLRHFPVTKFLQSVS